MRTRTKIGASIGFALGIVVLIFLTACHKALPYFAEIPVESMRDWQPESYISAGKGQGWELKRLREPTAAMTHDIDHWVWLHDGKAFDLRNTDDTWGFANARSWEFELIGSRLYVYDAHEHYPTGWLHVVPDGWSITSATTPPPANAIPSAVYSTSGGTTHLVADAKSYKDFLAGQTGDYYFAQPGEGVVKVFELNPTLQRAPTK